MTKSILCFGDSNTHGTRALRFQGDTRRFGRDARWPNVLGALLGPGYEVLAEGHPGRTTVWPDPIEGMHKAGAPILPALLETHRPVDLVIVMLGTNDLKVRFSVSAYEIARSVDRLVEIIQTSSAGPEQSVPSVLIVSPVPIVETAFFADQFAGGAEKSRALAGHLAVVAEARRTRFFDAAQVAEVDPADGIHLTSEGQGAIGRALEAPVRRALGETI